MKKGLVISSLCVLCLLTGCGKNEGGKTSKTEEMPSKVETTQDKDLEEMKKEVTDLKKELSKMKKESSKESDISEESTEQSIEKENSTTGTKSLEEQAHERYREAEAAGASPEAAIAYGDGRVEHWEDYKEEKVSNEVNNAEEAAERVLAIKDQWPKNNADVTLEIIEQLGGGELISDETGDYYAIGFKTNDPAPIEKSGFGMKAFRVYTDGRIDAQTRPTGTDFATIVSP